MNSKEALEFITKLIDFAKEQINYYENKIVEDEQYPSLQQCHKEELIASQEGLTHLQQIKQDLDRLEMLEKEYDTMKYCYEKLTKDYNSLKKDFNELFETSNIFYNIKEKYKKAIVSKKRVQSLRETANPIYEVVLHIPENLLKEVIDNE